ncbi:MAG: Wadjet anti-phage system protein JetD domain-containing protein [bacterium]
MDTVWQKHLAQEPGLEPYLRVLALKFVRTGVPPQSITLGPDPVQLPVRRALDFLFGGSSRKDGKLVVRLPERLRTVEGLQSLADLLGVAPAPEAGEAWIGALNTAVLRQGLLHPRHVSLLGELRTADELKRLFQQDAQAEKRLHGLLCAVEKLEDNRAAMTLSQLGAEALHDSKALRSGALLRLLVTMLARVGDMEEASPAQILSRFGVVDNPYTTLALVYGPVVYEDAHGRNWEWPVKLHEAGQAVAFTWEQVQGMRKMHPVGPVAGVITSENAAPFHTLVASRSSAICVYTEGYPNAAVLRVLELLAQAALGACHWGDTDLDGLRIAACVARVIPVALHGQGQADAREPNCDRRIPLTEAQRERALAYLAKHADFLFREALADTLQLGWLEQEQTGAPRF